MSGWNLERRMLAAALVWLAVAWGLGGTALGLIFRTAVVERFDAKLEALLDGLAPQVTRDADGRPVLGRAHPNFAEPASGWYWLLDDGSTRVVSSADPALKNMVLPPPTALREPLATNAVGPGDAPLRTMSRSVEAQDGSAVTLTVALDRREIDRELASFTSLLAAAALLLGLVLLAGILVQTRFALAPLRRLHADLAEVQAGRLEAVPENYPSDIRPVAEAINAVLERDQAVAAWARKSTGNLAHALKTELALLREAARGLPEDAGVSERTDRIAGIVDHHLSRATVGPEGSSRARADTRRVVAAVVAGLERIFAHRALVISADVSTAPDFRGEVQDLEEIVGNLMENACRHAVHEVRARAVAAGERLVLIVEDDGPGLDPAQQQIAVTRGERLDEKGPGAGLGLAIVNDLAELYGGRLSLGEAGSGGLEARVELPAAAA